MLVASGPTFRGVNPILSLLVSSRSPLEIRGPIDPAALLEPATIIRRNRAGVWSRQAVGPVPRNLSVRLAVPKPSLVLTIPLPFGSIPALPFLGFVRLPKQVFRVRFQATINWLTVVRLSLHLRFTKLATRALKACFPILLRASLPPRSG
jgi:hypothetical protein